jgi:YHS domain-containing protein
MKSKIQIIAILLMAIQINNSVNAQTAPADYIAKHIYAEQNIAVDGYDVVAYFSKQAIRGNAKYTITLSGIKYYFSSEANKELFAKNPSMYLPQYGGWCAYAMGYNGEKVSINPKTYKITDGKLYLFYNANLNNTLKSWNKNEAALKTKADTNWLKITQ